VHKIKFLYIQLAKRLLFEGFSKQSFGVWLKKPIEADQFMLMSPEALQEVTKSAVVVQDADVVTAGNADVSTVVNADVVTADKAVAVVEIVPIAMAIPSPFHHLVY
jgi:hypothetical protein